MVTLIWQAQIMKYMTFNSSCSYAGVANMLEQFGIDTTDREIALQMGLPYLFSFDNGVYLSGPMLQSADWFNLYLNPIGFSLTETPVEKENLDAFLKNTTAAMLGIMVDEDEKHAVVYIGRNGDQLLFVNNKWADDPSAEKINLTIDDLKNRIDDVVMVATIEKINPAKVNIRERLKNSVGYAKANCLDIIKLSQAETAVSDLRAKLNILFRPFFLDGITMMNLIGETKLAKDLTLLQGELLFALRQQSDKKIFLKDYISLKILEKSVKKYVQLIEEKI